MPVPEPLRVTASIPDGAHTHGSGGSGLGPAVLVLVGAALAVKLAGPVLGAVSELVHMLLIALRRVPRRRRRGRGRVHRLPGAAQAIASRLGGAPASPCGGAASTDALRAAGRDRAPAGGSPAPAWRVRRGHRRHPRPPERTGLWMSPGSPSAAASVGVTHAWPKIFVAMRVNPNLGLS
jgi:hypothetical protein